MSFTPIRTDAPYVGNGRRATHDEFKSDGRMRSDYDKRAEAARTFSMDKESVAIIDCDGAEVWARAPIQEVVTQEVDASKPSNRFTVAAKCTLCALAILAGVATVIIASSAITHATCSFSPFNETMVCEVGTSISTPVLNQLQTSATHIATTLGNAAISLGLVTPPPPKVVELTPSEKVTQFFCSIIGLGC